VHGDFIFKHDHTQVAIQFFNPNLMADTDVLGLRFAAQRVLQGHGDPLLPQVGLFGLISTS
jgi:hypothetical protein